MTFPACNPHAVRYRGWRTAIPLMVLAFGLIGCSTYQNVIDKFKDPIVLKCPVYKVVGSMENLVRFRDGPGRDLIDVDFEGKITGVDLSCLSEIDRKTKSGTLEVDVTLRMVASRGPANRNRRAKFDYFFKVLDKRGNPIWFLDEDGKKLEGIIQSVNITFPGNKTRIQFRTQPFTMPLPINSQWSNRYYRIFTGLKLTREELQFNRDKFHNSRARPPG